MSQQNIFLMFYEDMNIKVLTKTILESLAFSNSFQKSRK